MQPIYQRRVFRATDGRRKCHHNNWDNVRAEKQFITLRCRECQRQHRIGPSDNWKAVDWKCHEFNTPEGCVSPTCDKYHVNHKKQTLEERARIHGLWVVNYVRLGKGGSEMERKVRNLKKTLPTTGSKHSHDEIPKLLTTPVDDNIQLPVENPVRQLKQSVSQTRHVSLPVIKNQQAIPFTVQQQPVLLQAVPQAQFVNFSPAAAAPNFVRLQQNIAIAPQLQIVNNNSANIVTLSNGATLYPTYTPVWGVAGQ